MLLAQSKRSELPVILLTFGVFVTFIVSETFLSLLYRNQNIRLNLLDVLFWGGLIFWSIYVRVRLPLNASMSQLFLFVLALIVLTPPWVAPLFAFFPRWSKKIWYKELFNRSQDGLSTAVAALVWTFFQKNPLYLGPWILSAGVGITLAALAFFLVNTSLVTLVIHLSSGTPWKEIWRKNFKWLSISYFLLSPMALLLARAYETPLIGNWGGWTVLLFLVPLYYSRYYWDEKVRLEQAFDTTLEVLMNALEAKEKQTRMHSERVADIARDLAKAFYNDEAKAQEIYRAARLHDIGKIAIPEAVLLKPGKLTEAEFDLIKSHTKLGAELLSPARKVAFDQLVYNVILYHHERWDGRGYPEGLAGQDIPEEARIVGLADAYEAMTAGRPYREAKSPEEALKEVQDFSGVQFDPKLVRLFTVLWNQNPIWRDREAYLAAKGGSVSPSTLPQPSSESSLPSSSEPGSRTSES
ncbi:HD-GYP domain-containing protein [Thermus oshimai]|uniref:HD-GYP domain-containing protein n=2 Tax=Thermus TaxID=270 RepID=UPI00059D7034|nr:HD domain-containing phosphohydrolase [Thermus oshimai]